MQRSRASQDLDMIPFTSPTRTYHDLKCARIESERAGRGWRQSIPVMVVAVVLHHHGVKESSSPKRHEKVRRRDSSVHVDGCGAFERESKRLRVDMWELSLAYDIRGSDYKLDFAAFLVGQVPEVDLKLRASIRVPRQPHAMHLVAESIKFVFAAVVVDVVVCS